MSCPTCSHTMQQIGFVLAGESIFWCPRCGTIQPKDELPARPKLVDRCREYREHVLDRPDVAGHEFRIDEWRRIGVAESLNTPGDRP